MHSTSHIEDTLRAPLTLLWWGLGADGCGSETGSLSDKLRPMRAENEGEGTELCVEN